MRELPPGEYPRTEPDRRRWRRPPSVTKTRRHHVAVIRRANDAVDTARPGDCPRTEPDRRRWRRPPLGHERRDGTRVAVIGRANDAVDTARPGDCPRTEPDRRRWRRPPLGHARRDGTRAAVPYFGLPAPPPAALGGGGTGVARGLGGGGATPFPSPLGRSPHKDPPIRDETKGFPLVLATHLKMRLPPVLARLAKIVPQMPAARRMAQLPKRLGLNLPDSLTGDVEVLANLLERVVLAILKPKAHFQHLALSFGQY